jgi:hypothetical protein
MDPSSKLSDAIRENESQLRPRLFLGKVRWDDLIQRVERAELAHLASCVDEQVWTFLLACAYAAAEDGPLALARALTGRVVGADRIWLEVLPTLTRRREGYTNVDLALGTIARRAGKYGGIELGSARHNEVVFCEFKWFSDISTTVSNDQHRNQLARVIESALMFRSPSGVFAPRVDVVLVTPKVFRDCRAPSRLYRYKWEDYSREDRTALVTDLEECCMQPVGDLPSVSTRLGALALKWTAYEELAFTVPPSPLRGAFAQFYSQFAGSHLAPWPNA